MGYSVHEPNIQNKIINNNNNNKYKLFGIFWPIYNRLIGLVVVECSPVVRETWVQIPGHVIPKTLKMVLDSSLLNTQQYKIRIKSKE